MIAILFWESIRFISFQLVEFFHCLLDRVYKVSFIFFQVELLYSIVQGARMHAIETIIAFTNLL